MPAIPISEAAEAADLLPLVPLVLDLPARTFDTGCAGHRPTTPRRDKTQPPGVALAFDRRQSIVRFGHCAPSERNSLSRIL
ncbi:MAG: hypothetical protein AB7U73_18185 [Pirellulales bacterium]